MHGCIYDTTVYGALQPSIGIINDTLGSGGEASCRDAFFFAMVYLPFRSEMRAIWCDSVGGMVYVSGGMHSDPGARMPVWTGELAQFAAVLPAVEEWQRHRSLSCVV